MRDGLNNIRATLAHLTDVELHAADRHRERRATDRAGLPGGLEHLADWEQHQRRDSDFPLQPPDAAIDPSEDAASIATAIALREMLVVDVPAVSALFDAILGVLTGGARRH